MDLKLLKMLCKDSKQHHVMFHELYSVSSLLCIAQNVRFEIPYKVSYFETPFLMIFKYYAWASYALSWSTKRTVLTQEVLRVLMNCSKLLPWERVVENVNEMVLRCGTRGTARSSDMRLSTRPSRRIKQGIRLIRKESDRYIDPKSGGKANENKKR